MICVAHGRSVEVWLHRQERPYKIEKPTNFRRFAVMFVSLDASISATERSRLSKSTVNVGCRYVLISASNAKSWLGAMNIAFAECSPEEPFVTAISQKLLRGGEKDIYGALEFFMLASIDGIQVTQFIVELLAGSQQLESEVKDAVTAVIRDYNL